MISRLAALLTAGFLIWGGLLFADWLRGRERAASLPARSELQAEAPLVRAPDVRMDAYLADGVSYGPVRQEAFGRDAALFCSGQSAQGPDQVFASILERMQRGVTRRAIVQALRAGPSAIAALRMQARVGLMPGGAVLMRMAPVADGERMRMEPGGLVLAYGAGTHWEYVVYYFPKGLDLSAFIESFAAPRDALAPLGEPAGELLEPTMVFGGGPGAPRTIICRAHGRAADAVRASAAGLESRGWRPVHRTEEAAVLHGPAGEIWITTDQPAVAGGVVTIMIGVSG